MYHLTCVHCGSSFTSKNRRQKCCSRLCANAVRFGASTPAERFWFFVDKTPTCWNWTRNTVQRNGYFYYKFNGQNRFVHRYVYEALVGPIPDGLTIDHLCHNKRCVNPHHLEATTLHENVYRPHAARTGHAIPDHEHCIYGHPAFHMNGRKRCHTCERERNERRRHPMQSVNGLYATTF